VKDTLFFAASGVTVVTFGAGAIGAGFWVRVRTTVSREAHVVRVKYLVFG